MHLNSFNITPVNLKRVLYKLIKATFHSDYLCRFFQTSKYGIILHVLSSEYFLEFCTSVKRKEKSTYTTLHVGQLNDTKYATSGCRKKLRNYSVRFFQSFKYRTVLHQLSSDYFREFCPWGKSTKNALKLIINTPEQVRDICLLHGEKTRITQQLFR